jgi:hypothetical protein
MDKPQNLSATLKKKYIHERWLWVWVYVDTRHWRPLNDRFQVDCCRQLNLNGGQVMTEAAQ